MLGQVQNNAANMAKLTSQQQKLQKLLSGIRVTGSSKNGKVTVTITGEQKIVEVNIDPALIKFVHDNFIVAGKQDTMLGKAVMEAFEDAVSKVQAKVVEEMQKTGSIGDLMDMLQAASSMGNNATGQ
jgi:DNA-binding protein YbaB